MKVLVLAQYFPPDVGGASTRASNVVKGLLGRGCEVKVVAAFPHYPHGKVPMKYKGKPIVPEKSGGAKVLRVWIPSLPHSGIVNRVILHMCFVVSSLFALPFVSGFDVIFAANPNLFCFYSAIVYSFIKRKPVVRNVDDLWPEVFYELGLVQSGLMQKVLDLLAWLSYVVPVAITPVSAGYKRRITEKYKVCADKVHVIEVGVDTVEPLNLNVNNKHRFVVMYSGVLGSGYDFDVVLEAAGLLARNENVVFVIRGVGELALNLRRRVRQLDLKNVILDTKFLTKAKLSVLLRSADVFVLPMARASLVEEGLPTKVFEYQTYGKPIICISCGEPGKYVEATRSGLVVKPGDFYGFADAVVRLYKNKKLASELGWNGWRYVSEKMTAKTIGERMKEVFDSITENVTFPSKQHLTQLLGRNDFFFWQYYGEGFLSRIQACIFRSRIKVVMEFLRRLQLKPTVILDVGCGPMFLSYPLVGNSARKYIGVDIMGADKLRKYRDTMRKIGVKTINAVRASAKSLPFRKGIFDFTLSLDVLEHLDKPRESATEVYRVVRNDGMVAISLPLENRFQKACRVGFIFMKIMRHPTLRGTKWMPITRTPEYHYGGDVKSYDSMIEVLKEFFDPLLTRYTPIGIHESINLNAVHILQRSS